MIPKWILREIQISDIPDRFKSKTYVLMVKKI